jgi:hypothetical protein
MLCAISATLITLGVASLFLSIIAWLFIFIFVLIHGKNDADKISKK